VANNKGSECAKRGPMPSDRHETILLKNDDEPAENVSTTMDYCQAECQQDLRFRHWGRLAAQEAVPNRRVVLKEEVDDPKRFQVWQGCAVGMAEGRWRWPSRSDRDSPGNGTASPERPAFGRQRMNGGAAPDYGARAVSSREYCSRSMRLSFSRNLPRTGSAMSSRILPNSASVSRQNRCR
jgi:hypothetical protein